MSELSVRKTIKAAIMDPEIGLQARAQAVSATEGLEIATDFSLDPWMLSGIMKPSGQHNVSVTPRSLSANVKLPNEGFRDGVPIYQISFETFAADPSVIEDVVSVFCIALMQVIDMLRDYSDQNGGTILQVLDPLSFSFGDFSGGNGTSNGFTCSVQIQERGND